MTGTAGRASVEDLKGNRLLLQVGGSVETIEVKARPRATHRPLVADFCRTLIRGGSVRCSGKRLPFSDITHAPGI